jgi:hypothetical protein
VGIVLGLQVRARQRQEVAGHTHFFTCGIEPLEGTRAIVFVEEIEVFTGEPREAYEEIGILEGEGSLWKADLEDVIPKLKEEACRVGGDGLILRSAQRYNRGDDGLGDVEMYAFATVIRWSR